MASVSQNLDFANPSEGVYIITGLNNGLAQLVDHLESNSAIHVSRLLISDSSAHEVETKHNVEVYDDEMMYGRGRSRENEVQLGEEEELAKEDEEHLSRVVGEEHRHERAKKDIKLKYAILRQQALLGQILRRVAPGLEALSYLEYKEPPWDGWLVHDDSVRLEIVVQQAFPKLKELTIFTRRRMAETFPPSLPFDSSKFPSVTHLHLHILLSLPSLDDFSRLFPNLTHIRLSGFSSTYQLPKELQSSHVSQGVAETLREWAFGYDPERAIIRMPIPSNLTIILQPSYPVRSNGFCATSSIEYDSIYPVMERITRLHPYVHFIWPSKVYHDAGKPLFPVERAVEMFETRREWERDDRSEKDMWWRRQTRTPSIEELDTDVNVDMSSNL
ncbi:hypothetical protein ARMGADRAFT_1008510 [Armillaria gallica]|uniref:Uncharacterized protein n=1 Tax=Armillaria gallica TaxID=47427 RepID=A0A2H3E8G7_ARMGA|nr:hypothetical protein ARMGADRAFT_1008510 [Armillaria gallica]